jgi:hypothetical protein
MAIASKKRCGSPIEFQNKRQIRAMDNYPDHLGVELDMRSIPIPFMEWWPQTKTHFSHVPENVAEQWLHRHWNGSPFG